MKEVIIYTDGACSYNPGPGGWAGILIYGKHEKIVTGFEKETTNNRMELTAVIKSLEQLKEPCMVTVYTDSAYVYNAITQDWIKTWQENNWKNSQNKKVLNIELWQNLSDLLSKHEITFVKVKGHADNVNNNRCDKLARAEIEKNAK